MDHVTLNSHTTIMGATIRGSVYLTPNTHHVTFTNCYIQNGVRRYPGESKHRAIVPVTLEALHALLKLPNDMRIVEVFVDPQNDTANVKVEAAYLPEVATGARIPDIDLERAQAGVAGQIARDLLDSP